FSGLIENRFRGVDLDGRDAASEISCKRLHGVGARALQFGDGFLDNLTPRGAVGGLKVPVLKPAPERDIAHPALFRRRAHCRLRDQSGDCLLLLATQFFTVTVLFFHLPIPAFIAEGTCPLRPIHPRLTAPQRPPPSPPCIVVLSAH